MCTYRIMHAYLVKYGTINNLKNKTIHDQSREFVHVQINGIHCRWRWIKMINQSHFTSTSNIQKGRKIPACEQLSSSCFFNRHLATINLVKEKQGGHGGLNPSLLRGLKRWPLKLIKYLKALLVFCHLPQVQVIKPSDLNLHCFS